MISFLKENGLVRIPNLIKWAGGKNNLVKILMNYVPKEFETYYEPFFGGGSLYWNLKLIGRIENAVISDINSDLVNLLQVVQSRPDELATEISNFRGLGGAENFYRIRDEFNSHTNKRGKSIEKAAMFIYLNRNGYNGLWRTNKKGKYNVPYGYYKSFHLPSFSEILFFSHLLENTVIRCCSYIESIKFCNRDDLVYLDPPYLKAKFSNFTQYSKESFNLEDQWKLANLFGWLTEKGVKIMTTNRQSVEIHSLYHGYAFFTFNNIWSINRNGSDRKGKKEILITNF